MRLNWLVFSALCFLTGCSGLHHNTDYSSYLARKGVTKIEPARFQHCRGYGCRLIDDDLILGEPDWQALEALFSPPATDAAQERAQIAAAIGLFEQAVGAKTGSEADRRGTYHKLGDDQHDCVDESVNTTIYLALLDRKGWLAHHTPGAPTARLPLFGGGLGPHQTAVIIERETGESFAVDSWFHDNGHPAMIAPLAHWYRGWRPAIAKSAITASP